MTRKFTSLEIFSGAGGLATGLTKAGAEHVGFIEWNTHKLATPYGKITYHLLYIM